MHFLAMSARNNREFLKVLNILQNDPELRPLIFEHEALLKALKDMSELKAEQMLSILTAAETEMYESSKKNEETQQLQRSRGPTSPTAVAPKDMKSTEVQTIRSDEVIDPSVIDRLKKKNEELSKDKATLEQELKQVKQDVENRAVSKDGAEDSS